MAASGTDLRRLGTQRGDNVVPFRVFLSNAADTVTLGSPQGFKSAKTLEVACQWVKWSGSLMSWQGGRLKIEKREVYFPVQGREGGVVLLVPVPVLL